jgi:hypothetical protein
MRSKEFHQMVASSPATNKFRKVEKTLSDF